jgi:membrane-bound ClpP family serine protease
MAAHAAAMAPPPHCAAHPVRGAVDKEMVKKVENDAAAFARTMPPERGQR